METNSDPSAEGTVSGNDGLARGPGSAKLRAIVFDLDGTLYSQPRLRVAMGLRLLREMMLLRIPVKALRVLRNCRRAHEVIRQRGLPVNRGRTQLEMTSEMSRLPIGEVEVVVSRWFYKEPLKHMRACAVPGLSEFLTYAHAAGIRLGVLSDYSSEEKLAAIGLAEYFDVVISSSDEAVDRLKPNPKGLLRCLSALDVQPQEAVYVGDRPEVDAECAKRAGVNGLIVGRRGMRIELVLRALRTRIVSDVGES